MDVETPRYRPADYYAAPSPERVLPEWVTWTSGAVAGLVLVLIFAGGAFLAQGGLTQMMDLVFGMTLGEMRGMYTPDVRPGQRESLEREIETLRRNLRDEKIPVQKLQPLLQTIRKAMRDEKLDPKEVGWIEAVARELNRSRNHV